MLRGAWASSFFSLTSPSFLTFSASIVTWAFQPNQRARNAPAMEGCLRSRAGVVLRARGALRWPLSLLSPSLGSSRDQPPIFCLPSLFARRIAGTFEENTSGALRRAPAARRPARARPTDRPTDRPPARPPAAAARAPARPTAHVLSGPCVGPWVRGITERTFTGKPSRLRSRALFGASPVPFAAFTLPCDSRRFQTE